MPLATPDPRRRLFVQVADNAVLLGRIGKSDHGRIENAAGHRIDFYAVGESANLIAPTRRLKQIGQVPSVLWPVIERKNGMIAPENFVITIVENAVATPCDIFGRVCEGKIPFAESGSRFCYGGFGRNESKKVA